MRFLVLCAIVTAVVSSTPIVVLVDFDLNVALFNVSFTDRAYSAAELCLHACGALPCVDHDDSLRLVALPMPSTSLDHPFVAPFEFGALNSSQLQCAEIRFLENKRIAMRCNGTAHAQATTPSLASVELHTTDQGQTQAVLCFSNLVQPIAALCHAQAAVEPWEWPFAVVQLAGVSQRSQLVVLTPELLSNQPASVKLTLIECYQASNGDVFNVTVTFSPAMMAAHRQPIDCTLQRV
jgi:hypothetical protein